MERPARRSLCRPAAAASTAGIVGAMPRRLRVFLLLVFVSSAPGCGSGADDGRPNLVASFPASGTTVESGLTSLRLTFDEPVRLFLPYQVQVFREGVFVGMRVFQLPGEDRSVRLTPLFGEALLPGDYVVRVLEGLVLDADEHYALDSESLTFQVGGTPSFFVGSPLTNQVTTLDDATLTVLTSTPTPGGRDPVGLLAQRQGTLPRVFVQLASGGGTGKALAAFSPGDALMSEVTLTTSGGDLTAPAATLALDPEGVFLYAAFVDVSAQRVRVARVRTADAVETGSLLLSFPAAADSTPTGLTLLIDNLTLLVTAQAAGLGRVAYVDLVSFTEQDRNPGTPGIQAALLGTDAGPTDLSGDGASLLVAPPLATTADLYVFTLGADTGVMQVALQAGSPTALRVGFDGGLVFEGLFAGPVDEPLVVRLSTDLSTTTPIDVVDDVGGVDQGTTRVRALAQVPAQPRLYVLLDADCLARFSWAGADVTQDDLDPGTTGIQVLKLSGTAAGATSLGTVGGSVP